MAGFVDLLVPVWLSASHVAFVSLRMEAQYQMLGHAAWMALDSAPHDIPVNRLQADLRDSGQVLSR